MPQTVTAEAPDHYVTAPLGANFAVTPGGSDAALLALAPDGRLVAIGARWRADTAAWDPISEGTWHDLYVTFGDDPREYYAGHAWRNTVVETIARTAYDDVHGFDLRRRIFPVEDVDPCRCRYTGQRCASCGHEVNCYGFGEAATAVERHLYGAATLG
ncbi:hypothetical protein ABT093_19650 [Kitasatospora sp. NPDC002551]|uniref:hypothetical protein n=1 Tax=Kitasatospora sp. NPDC002551 TaxID=3154539 RepID=UPI00331DA316